MDTPFPFGFPWATAFYLTLYVLTFGLHLLANPFAPFSEHFSSIWNNQGPFALIIVVLLPIFVYDTIKLSNRFAGPVLRLRRVMRDIAEGKPAEKLTFRDNDFWQGMANDFNALIDQGYFDNVPSTDGGESEAEPELQEVG